MRCYYSPVAATAVGDSTPSAKVLDQFATTAFGLFIVSLKDVSLNYCF